MIARRVVAWAWLLSIASACASDDDGARRSGIEHGDGGLDGATASPWRGAGKAGSADESGSSGSAGSAGSRGTAGASAVDAGGSEPEPRDAGRDAAAPSMMCLPVTEPCDDVTQCCGDLSCDTTSLGQVCCGEEGAPCATPNGEDCCRDLLCIAGHCGYRIDTPCNGPCTAPPALVLERERLDAIGGSFLGICGDANHTYGYHVAAANLPASDYSLEGAANDPVCEWHAAAIDIGMDWPASRDWLRWLIQQVQTGGLTGIAEVIGSYDGSDVRYWSDSSGWTTEGEPYTGSGHDSWTHVSIHRSTALQDHRILAGWTATGGP
jgi:hypothetical protein